jgi:hypothetical protein
MLIFEFLDFDNSVLQAHRVSLSPMTNFRSNIFRTVCLNFAFYCFEQGIYNHVLRGCLAGLLTVNLRKC